MPFPRKKLKIVTDGSSGRDITYWRNSSCGVPCNQECLDADGPRHSNEPIIADHDCDDDGPNFFDEGTAEGCLLSDDARKNSRTQTYEEIKRKDVESWRKLRKQLLQVAIARSGFPTSVESCLVCQSAFFSQTSSQEETLYSCSDCGPFYYVCFSCLVADHKLRPHHIPEVWNGHFFEAFPLHDVEKPVEIPFHVCMSKYKRILKIANSKGQVQEMWIVFCGCEPEAITLLKLDLWPSSSKKPTTAYHIDLLRSLRALMLECHVSVLGFTNAMRWKNDISKQQANSLYRLLVNESFEEFRHFVYQLDTYREICPAVDDGSACMLCPKEKGKVILMMDGTFGCVRKSSSGRSVEGPKHASRLFLDQFSVDNFVDSHSGDSKNIQLDCSSFKAGRDNFHTNIQRKKLDVFGIFGCSCKHEIPKCFLNMKHGERLAYPVYLLQTIMEPYKTSGTDFYVIYDIACLLSKHIKDWIGNQKKILSGKKYERRKKSVTSVRKRKLSARDIFQEEFLKDNQGKMAGLEACWSDAKADPNRFEAYLAIANQRNEKATVLSEDEKEAKVMSIRKEIQKHATELSTLGFECMGLIVKPGTDLCAQFGTSKGKMFLESSQTYWQFISHLIAPPQPKQSSRVVFEDLRTAVQEKLNKAYKESGVGGNRVEWARVREGEIVVKGFPDELVPAPASNFGIDKLERLLKNDIKFTFEVKRSDEAGQGGAINLLDPDQITRIIQEGENEADSETQDDSETQEDEQMIPQTSTSSEGIASEMFIVESLLAKRRVGNVTHYLVKWQGFEEPTLEPHFNIPNKLKRGFNSNLADDNI